MTEESIHSSLAQSARRPSHSLDFTLDSVTRFYYAECGLGIGVFRTNVGGEDFAITPPLLVERR